jgi:hypothetical protein
MASLVIDGRAMPDRQAAAVIIATLVPTMSTFR